MPVISDWNIKPYCCTIEGVVTDVVELKVCPIKPFRYNTLLPVKRIDKGPLLSSSPSNFIQVAVYVMPIPFLFYRICFGKRYKQQM